MTPWWTEWVKAGPTLLGVTLGAGATLLVTVIQRRWQQDDSELQRREKERLLVTSRGEDLLSQCQLLVEWKEDAKKTAFTGDGKGFVPSQGPIYRIAAIVELFFPELSARAQALDTAVLAYRHIARGIAMLVQAGAHVSPAQVKDLRDEETKLEQTLTMFMQTARAHIRKHIDSRPS